MLRNSFSAAVSHYQRLASYSTIHANPRLITIEINDQDKLLEIIPHRFFMFDAFISYKAK
jgi:hypothetical protein